MERGESVHCVFILYFSIYTFDYLLFIIYKLLRTIRSSLYTLFLLCYFVS